MIATLKAMTKAISSLCLIFGLGCLMLHPAAIFGQSPADTPATGSMNDQHNRQAHAATPVSTTLTVTVNGKATTLSLADMQAMPQQTITVHNEHTKLDETYSGVALGDLLAKYGFPVNQATHRAMLRSYIVAEGMDKYWVLYSTTEVEGSEHKGDVIVATTIGGKPIAEDGQFKLVSSEDKKPQRWVRNLTAITLKNAE